MNTRLLEALLAVHRYGSMAEAARRLNLTHGGVAQQIRTLEQSLGVDLVRRAGRSVHLTKAAHRVLGQAQKILEDVDAMSALAKADTLKGELQLAAGGTVLTHKMAEILMVLNDRYPDIGVNLLPGVSADFYDMLEHNVIDAAIATESSFALPKSLGWRHLTQEPFFLLAAARHQGRDPLDLLGHEPLIRYQRGSWVRNIIDSYLKQEGITARGQFELASTETIVALVHRDIGVAIVPSSWQLWRQNSDVIAVALNPACRPRVLGVVWSKASPRLQLIEAFWRAAVYVYSNKRSGLP